MISLGINTNYLIYFFVSFFIYNSATSQIDTNYSLCFDFDNHQISEKNNKLITKACGVTHTTDRFGNEGFAIYAHGHQASYVNLGTSILLKPKQGTISIWVNLEKRAYLGRGAVINPILTTKNSEGDDFTDALAIVYNCEPNRFNIGMTKDSLKEVAIFSKERVVFNRWYHLVLTFNDNFAAFYINGQLQNRINKGFTSTYLNTDSLMLGYYANKKNERYSIGSFDDIQIFHRILSSNEINKLYNAPNPNRFRNILNVVLKYGLVVIFFSIIILFIIFQNKNKLKKQKEKYELNQKINELELKVVKSQMNPHFISNCLAAIQDLIYKNEVDSAGLYISKFSYFIRKILYYSDTSYIKLSQEIEMIKLNIDLEKLRFKNNFEYEIEIEKDIDTDEIVIPSLITQPFIENAIWHGLIPLNEIRLPFLKIKIYKNSENLFLEISDNGVGRNLNVEKNLDKKSKGTKLVQDKIYGLNSMLNKQKYNLVIVDLLDKEKKPIGTKVVLEIYNYQN